ncbi:MAG: recombinase zinc beta ribbon domain-containing protein, partial [Phycisphaerales bacterium]|nr:recombinase zinc beta ribbon domain-containing protein [Phycisphaerales bacterium]
EREIISERTRDKIVAARRKGLWTGGRPLLGFHYDKSAGRLTIDQNEATRVREAFALYESTRSLQATARALNAKGWTTKAWTSKAGAAMGGRPFTKTNTYALLTNVLYIGKVRCGTEVHEGQHEAIVDPAAFERVRALLRDAGRTGGTHISNKHGALLKTLLVCGPCGRAMTHVMVTPQGKRKSAGRATHRYYRCQSDLKRGRGACPSRSLPAKAIEDFVVGRVREIGKDPDVLAATLDAVRQRDEAALAALKAERAALGQDLAGIAKEAGSLAGAGDGPRVAAVRADLEDRRLAAESRLADIACDERDLAERHVARADLRAALHRFDDVWAELSPAEQARALRLLVARVEFDAAKGSMAITFHEGAPAALTSTTAQEAA